MDKLKACPTCEGGSPYETEENGVEKIVRCAKCGTVAFISSWNNRPIEDSLQSSLTASEAREKKIVIAAHDVLNTIDELHWTPEMTHLKQSLEKS